MRLLANHREYPLPPLTHNLVRHRAGRPAPGRLAPSRRRAARRPGISAPAHRSKCPGDGGGKVNAKPVVRKGGGPQCAACAVHLLLTSPSAEGEEKNKTKRRVISVILPPLRRGTAGAERRRWGCRPRASRLPSGRPERHWGLYFSLTSPILFTTCPMPTPEMRLLRPAGAPSAASPSHSPPVVSPPLRRSPLRKGSTARVRPSPRPPPPEGRGASVRKRCAKAGKPP